VDEFPAVELLEQLVRTMIIAALANIAVVPIAA
jgi:hypothetical protein